MRNAIAIFLCAGLFSMASKAYAGNKAPATPAAAKNTQTEIALSTDERAELAALDAQSGVLLEQQSAGRACQGSGDTDCTRTTDCSSQVLTFGIVGVLVGSFGGAAGAVGGGAIGAGLGYGICASAN